MKDKSPRPWGNAITIVTASIWAVILPFVPVSSDHVARVLVLGTAMILFAIANAAILITWAIENKGKEE